MAQNYKGLEKAINQLFEDYTNSLGKAVKHASKQAEKDIYTYANTCLQEYYDSYDPTSYDRTYNLHRSIVPYSETVNEGNRIVIHAGVGYDASILADTYYGSKKYSPTDSEWVLSNYLRGVHPATNGATFPGETFYYENVDPISPTQKMSEYLDNYVKKIRGNIILGFVKQII